MIRPTTGTKGISGDEPPQGYELSGDVTLQVIPCAVCGGKGKFEGRRCPACGGHKTVTLPRWLIISPKAKKSTVEQSLFQQRGKL